MKFVFHINMFVPVPGKPGWFDVVGVERFARTVEQALELAQSEIPAGHRVWAWHTEPDSACTMCGGPFHPATGHWVSRARHWCGACARGMYAMLKTFTPRRWGGVRFYDHATVPVGDTSAQDLAGESR